VSLFRSIKFGVVLCQFRNNVEVVANFAKLNIFVKLKYYIKLLTILSVLLDYLMCVHACVSGLVNPT